MKSSLRSAALVVALGAIASGCLSTQNQSSLDGTTSKDGVSTQPFVELFVEYPGPQAKWAGPASYVLHVTAKDGGDAEIAFTPKLLTAKPEDAELPGSKDAPTVSEHARVP